MEDKIIKPKGYLDIRERLNKIELFKKYDLNKCLSDKDLIRLDLQMYEKLIITIKHNIITELHNKGFLGMYKDIKIINFSSKKIDIKIELNNNEAVYFSHILDKDFEETKNITPCYNKKNYNFLINKLIVLYLRTYFTRMSKNNALTLYKLLLSNKEHINITDITNDWIGLHQYNRSKFKKVSNSYVLKDSHKQTLTDEIKELIDDYKLLIDPNVSEVFYCHADNIVDSSIDEQYI